MLSPLSNFNWLSPSWQTTVFWLWAVSALGGAAVVAGSLMSSVIQYKISGATEELAQRDRAANAQKLAEANARAAEANARAEEAIRQTAEARLATEELRKQTIGRQFTDDQYNKMDELRSSGISIQTQTTFGDPEASIYAAQFVTYLKKHGVQAPAVQQMISGMYFSIKVFGPDDRYTRAIRDIFEMQREKVEYEEATEYRVYIGSRLPPFIVP